MSEKLVNEDALDRLDQGHSAYIQKMFWVACSSESEELKELLDELSPKSWADLFPDIKYGDIDDMVDEVDYVRLLIDKRKLGLLAECRIPTHHEFIFDDKGDVRACSVSYSRQTIFYAYGETREELLQAIEKQAEEIYQQQLAKEKVS
jgi:hypothetical protein